MEEAKFTDGSNQIAGYFRNKTVLVTGITGFVGKVLLEKLLRSCSEVKNIYLLVRCKKGVSAQARINSILGLRLFRRVRKECPGTVSKIVVLQGDLTLSDLGLGNEELSKLLSEINVVIHSAATVRFDEPLKAAVKMNLVGTKTVVDLCNKMKKIEVLVHVSTCYCNCDKRNVEEVIYSHPIDPEHIIKIVDWLDEDTLSAVQPKLLKGKPNTYTFTKCLAETLVSKQAKGYPVAIVRPSIVVCSWKEPFPGWVDSYNGPTGLLLAVATGFLKSVYSNPSLVTDFIPVDVVVNCILAATWHTSITKPNDIQVYNCACGTRGPELRWKDVESFQSTILPRVPFVSAIRYPSINMRYNKFTHKMSMIFQHYLPAILGDMALRGFGKEPILLKSYYKIETMLDSLSYFTTNQWCFHTDRVSWLYRQLSKTDRKEFNFDMSSLNWESLFYHYASGIKQILCKEEHHCQKVAVQKFHRLLILKHATNVLFAVAAWKLLNLGPNLSKLWEIVYDVMFHTYNLF